MKKVRSKSLILPISLIVLSLAIIVSTTLAYFTDKQSSNNPVSFGKVEITAGEMETLSTPLRDVIAGSKITDKITFSKAVDSESMYVRAKVYFSTDSAVQAVKDLVAELNGYDLGALGESSAYSWSEAYNNIHYLVNKTDTSKAYALANNDVITLSNGFSIPTELKQSANLAQYMQKVSFNIEVQAIQSTTVDAGIKKVNKCFVDVFGDSAVAPPPYPVGKFTNVSGTAGYTDNVNLVGKYFIEMGSYPQTLYTGDASALTIENGETYTLENSSGTEATCPVYKDSSNNKYVQFTNSSSEVLYYKIEPVRWVVIGQADGSALLDDFDINTTSLDKVLVVSEKILAQKQFDDKDAVHTATNSYADFENSSLYAFMNNAFINELFTTEEQALIQNTTYSTTYYNGTAVQLLESESKMFMLAIANQTAYGGSTYGDTYLADLLNNGVVAVESTYASLLAKSTDLTKAMGGGVDSATGFGLYWLRSGNYCNDSLACYVRNNGEVRDRSVNSATVGVRPAFVMAL